MSCFCVIGTSSATTRQTRWSGRSAARRRNSRASPSCRAAPHGRRRARRRPAPARGGRSATHGRCRGASSGPSGRRCRPSAGTFGRHAPRSGGQTSRSGNISCFHSRPSSHCVPGATSKGPMSGVTSTPVRLKASEVMRRSRQTPPATGNPDARAGSWRPETACRSRPRRSGSRGRARASHMAVTQGWVTRSTKPREVLRVDLDVPAAGAAAHRAAGALDGLPERRGDVLAHVLGPVAREGALAADDAVAVERLDVGRDVGTGCGGSDHRMVSPVLFPTLMLSRSEGPSLKHGPASRLVPILRHACVAGAQDEGEHDAGWVRAAGRGATRAGTAPRTTDCQ